MVQTKKDDSIAQGFGLKKGAKGWRLNQFAEEEGGKTSAKSYVNRSHTEEIFRFLREQ